MSAESIRRERNGAALPVTAMVRCVIGELSWGSEFCLGGKNLRRIGPQRRVWATLAEVLDRPSAVFHTREKAMISIVAGNQTDSSKNPTEVSASQNPAI